MSSEYGIHLLRIAEEDFKEIIEYIARDSPEAAEKVASKIELGLMGLTEYPLLGRVPNEPELAGAGFRYIIIDHYLVFYSIEESTVFVHRIIHGARDYRRLL